MTTYTNIQAQTQASEPLTTTLVTALDRNLYAAMEGDPSATGFVQLQEPGITTATVSPVKIPAITKPTSTATGFFTNAVAYDYLWTGGDRLNSTNTVQTTKEQTIESAGTYTFVMRTSISQNSSQRIKAQLYIDGVLKVTQQQTTTTQVRFNQFDITLSGGESYYVKITKTTSGTNTLRYSVAVAALVSNGSVVYNAGEVDGVFQHFLSTNVEKFYLAKASTSIWNDASFNWADGFGPTIPNTGTIEILSKL
tara:strand:- start:396 stop:1151 length:756 start_codon:yes stop_codon:yes gene_type:complete